MASSYHNEKCAKYSAIIGAHFIMAPLSFLWTYGNFSAYIDSYFQFGCSSDCVDGDSKWIIGLLVASAAPGILLTKLLGYKLGQKRAGILGVILSNCGLFGSVWTIGVSVVWTTVLLGVVLGLGNGNILTVVFEHVSSWAPDKAAIFMATTSGGATALAVLQNQIITAIVNPKNLKPDVVRGSETFFSQREVLDKVPLALIAYAGMTAGLQVVGYLILRSPPKLSARPSLSENTAVKHSKTFNSDIAVANASQLSELQTEKPQYESISSDGNYKETRNDHSKIPLDTSMEEDKTPIQFENQQRSLKPSEVLKTPVFYAIFLYGFSNMYSLLLKSNFYKEFALLYIRDDRYLTLVGTFIPVVASVSRVFFGICINKQYLTIKDTIIYSISVNSTLCSFWYFVPQVSSGLYMVLILGLASVQSLYYALMPIACFYIFGPDYFSSNYGLLYSVLFIAGLMEPLAVTSLLEVLGWKWLFISSSIFSLIALLFIVSANFNVTGQKLK